MSQIKPSPVTDFRYETKVGFLFTVGRRHDWPHYLVPLEATIADPQSKTEDWWHFLLLMCQWQIPHQQQEYFFFNHPLLKHL